MSNLSTSQRQAIWRLCKKIATADTGSVNEAEKSALNQIGKFLKLSQQEINEAENADAFIALMSVNGIDRTSKIMLISLLQQVAEADGTINYQEQEDINSIRSMIQI